MTCRVILQQQIIKKQSDTLNSTYEN